MENNKSTNNEKAQTVNTPSNKPTPLFEDMNGHNHDQASYEKLMREQTNIRKDSNSEVNKK